MTDDSDLRARFDGLKSEDAFSAPPFSDCWEEARQSAGRRGRWILNVPGIAAAFALVVIAAFAIYIRFSRQASIDQISHWRSPTASLLSTPGSRLFTTVPHFGEPLIPTFKEQRN
jgi:hypothetical protein